MTDQEIPEGTVTVLFTDLVESTRLNQRLGDDGAREVGRQIEEMARRQIADNRGVLIKEMGDGLMAAFASARRAVAASRAIQTEIARMHESGLDEAVEMRIGLHTGEVLSEEGDIHGETVIIASRIEGLAPAGGILASETVYGVLGTAREDLVDQGIAQLKGIENEWRLYQVPVPDDDAGTVLADNEPTPYVGRAAEREQLRMMVEATAQGRGGMVLIGGPPGVGKSRLSRESAAIAQRLGMNVLTGNCLDMATPPPYQPIVDHLEQAVRATPPDRFREVLGENAPEVAKLLPSLRQRYDDIPPSPDLTPEQERRYMLHGVSEYIERAANERPLLLIYEDLHWADESTLLLLRHIGSRLAEGPVMVLGTYRDDELAPGRPLTTAIGPLIRDLGAVDIHPQLLTVDEVTTVLRNRAGQDPPPELIELVYSETQGNPFFVEELFRHLRDAGRLFDEDGAWRPGFEIGESEVPQGVRLVIEKRLEQLDSEHRRSLASAALIGRSFAFRHLLAVANADEDDLFDALEAAERLHLIEEVPPAQEARYLFVHEQIRQTLVGELSLARRQRVHVRIADALETDAVPPTVEIAHHLFQAGPVAPADRTAAALIDAAETNLSALAFEDALLHLDNAETFVADEDRIAFVSRKARALRGAGRVDEALALLDPALQAGAELRDEVDLRLQRVELLNDQYRAGEGLDDLAALVDATATIADPELEITLHLARGRAHYILSLDRPEHAAESRDAYQASYEAAKARGDKANMARALLPTTWFTDYWPDYGETASANVAEALALAEELGDEALVLDALTASMHRGGVRFNAEKSEALLGRLEAHRDPVRLNAHCFWLMWQYTALGRLEDAVAMCDRGIELADLIGSEPVQYGGIKAIALTELGRYDEVAAAIAQEVTDDDHPFGQAMASLARSFYLTRLCAWGPAADALADTLQRATDLSRVWMSTWAASLMQSVAAHCELDPDPEIIRRAGLRTMLGHGPRGLAAGEVALVEGRFADAADLVARLVPGPDDDSDRDHVAALELLARARLGVGDTAGAIEASSEALTRSEPMAYESLRWRMFQVRSLAHAADGRTELAEADAEVARDRFRVLASRIDEPDLRDWFERQPLAPV